MSPADLLTWVAATAAGIAAAGYIFKRVQWLFRTLDRLAIVVNQELNHNGGGSTKDRASQAAWASVRIENQIGDLATQVVDLSDLVNRHLTDPKAHAQ